MNIKRAISMALAVIMLTGSMVGCANGDSSSEQSKTSSKGNENTATGEAYFPDYEFDTKEITVCIDWAPSSAWVQRWEKAFKKRYPNVTVNYVQATPDEKASKLAIWYSSNQSPDVVYAKSEEVWPTLYNKGLIEAVDDYVDYSNPFWADMKSLNEQYAVDGKQYIMVTQPEPLGYILYNRTTFANAGLEEPLSLFYKGEWTMDVLKEYAQKLTRENTADRTKNRYGLYLHYLHPFIGITGKDFIEYTDGEWKTNFNDSNIVKMVEFLKEVGPTGQKYSWDDDVDPTQARAQTITGQIAMYVTAESPALEFPKEVADGTLSVVPMPMYNKDNGYIQYAVFDCFVIPKGSKNPEAGAAFAAAQRADVYLDKFYLESEEFSTETKNMYDYLYTSGKVNYTPATFRRLEGTYGYADILGRVYRNGETYSKVVAEFEPLILNALKSES